MVGADARRGAAAGGRSRHPPQRPAIARPGRSLLSAAVRQSAADTGGMNMRRFDQQSAIIAIELQQLVAEFAYEVDTNGSRNITRFYAEDGVFAVGDFTRKGHAAIDQFYADGAARAAAIC